MDSPSPVRTFGFPPQLTQAEIKTLGVRESFTWGPQALWLLCGLIWIFYVMVRDIPELARNTALIGAGATLLAMLGVAYQMRRRKRQTVLYPLGGWVGLYRGNVFQYSFVPAEMLRVRLDFFGWIMVVLKLLLPMLMLMVIVGVVMYDGMKHSGAQDTQGMVLFGYLMLFALFGFVAFYRSHIALAFFWVPNGKGKTDKPLHLHTRELQKMVDGDARAIR
ncbi:MAG: hypothetical protein WA738_06045 [Candidatus Angelobacter sp.]